MTPGFMSFGFSELLLVGVVALLVFGGNLPDVMRTLGRSYAKFRQSLHEFSRPVREEMRKITALPPDVGPIESGDDASIPEYPDHYETESDEGPVPRETDGAKGDQATAPLPPPEPEIDEPPPV